MTVVVRVLVGVLLLAHGLVHLLYLVPDVDAFTIESGPLPESVRRPVALTLLAGTVLASTLLALSVWGVPGLSERWPILMILAASLSAVLLLLFWDRQLVLGLAIDAALIALAVSQPGWFHDILPASS
ncbi:hypothetical protein ABEG17_09470 [Pedococcus sp. KACC 23699]|uniref:ABC transporter permease n=1 Tax=Pedococcus sp. KACC 23699 TaxID=3149228 RepID=A0AAU7JYK9_9MICO